MQKINLYKASAKPKKIWFKVAHMLAILSLTILAFASISGINFIKNRIISMKVDDLNEKKAKLNNDIKIIEASLPAKGLEESLEKRAEGLGKMRSARESMFRELSKLQKGQTTGFARYLLALWRYDIDGIWLTKFEFLNEGYGIVLEGKTSDPSKIPLLVSKIGSDPIFKGKKFESLNMARDEKDENLIKFSIRSD